MDLDRFDWLARRKETAIEPDLEIVDPHHHLWDRGGSTYLAEQLHADTSAGHRVVQTVFVDCMSKYDKSAPAHLRPVGETRFVAEQATHMKRLGGAEVAGIVGFVDLTMGNLVDEALEAQLAASSLFRGIRHATGWDASPDVHDSHTKPPPGLTCAADFIAGARRLAAHGLTFDAWLYHPQLDELVVLAAAVPELTIIVNHLGAPLGIGPYAGRRDDVLSTWRASMQRLAVLPNVFVKLGGFGLDTYFGTGWSGLDTPIDSDRVATYWGDVVRWCIDTFGPQRCMFESNFPVDRQALTYTVLWNACKKMTTGYDADERAALFAETARRAYSLSPCR